MNFILSIKKKLLIKTNYNSSFLPYQRIALIAVFIFLSITAIIFRLTYITVWPSALNRKLKTQAHKQTEIEILIAPPRGTISDRRGRILAASLIKPSLFIIPKRIPKGFSEKKQISKALNISLDKIKNISNKNNNFYWVHRFMEKEDIDKIKDISKWRDFIGWAEESKRYYPEGALASHLLGFVGNDGDGLAGIEYTQNMTLKVKAQKKKVIRDARGKITLINPGIALQPEPQPENVELTIDVVIQKIAESAIKIAVNKSRAIGGSVVVAHIPTGQILGLANYPSFHPENGPREKSDILRFRAISDGLEVGSILKPIILSYALQNKIIKKNELLYCEKGKFKLPGGYIHDTQPKSWLNPLEILKFSSNICMFKICKKMGRQSLHDAYIQSGLVGPTGIEIKGEWQSKLSHYNNWKEIRFANLSFGQGIAVSNLQVANAYVKLLSGEHIQKLTILKKNPSTSRIFKMDLESGGENETKQEVLDYIKKAMKSVINENGSGSLARVEGLIVGGKTGTAQKYDAKTRGYTDRVSSFSGFAPYDNPSIVVSVIIDSPQVRPAYGGLIAAPVFSRVVEESMKYLLSSSELFVHLDTKNSSQ